MAKETALVAQRCMEAQETGFINLSGCGLMAIPDAMYLFLKGYKVNKIDLSNNQLKSVSAKLPRAFPKVEEVDVSNNVEIRSLPGEFSLCEQLSVLNLAGNKLTNLPSVIFKSLQVMNMTNNIVENVSETDISNFSAVKKIILTENKLSSETKSRLKQHSNFVL